MVSLLLNGKCPSGSSSRHAFRQNIVLGSLILNPWIISAMVGAFFAMLSWLAAMTKFELSYAYPFMSLAFVLVLVLGAALFHESVTMPKVLGVALIVSGIMFASQG